MRHFLRREGTGFSEADDTRHIQRSRSHAALVAAAIDNGGNLHARILAANIQRAHTLGAIHFVAGYRKQIDVLLVHVDRNLADRLCSVAMEDDSTLATELADFCDGL